LNKFRVYGSLKISALAGGDSFVLSGKQACKVTLNVPSARLKQTHAVLQVSTNIILQITTVKNMAVSIHTEASFRGSTLSKVTNRIYSGKHALGDRARKIDQGILITRFELPFNIWW
jgi:hypothetical protein